MEDGMLARKIKEIERVGHIVGAGDKLITDLSKPKRIITGKIRPIINGEMHLFDVFRVHHVNPYPTGAFPYKGGTRYDLSATIEKLTVFAMDMTEKTVLAGLPFGGAKGGIPFDPRKFNIRELRIITEAMIIELFKHKIPHPDYDVLGPDMGTFAEIMDWILNKVGELSEFRSIPNPLASVTGKSLIYGGIPGRENATSHGLLLQLNEYRKISGINFDNDCPTIAIQGFGNVGANIAYLIGEDVRFPYKVIAVNNKDGGIYNKNGIDIKAIKEWFETHKTLVGYPEADAIDNEELLTLPADILIPAAMENQITFENADAIRAKLIFEGANEGVTPDAYEILFDRGIPAVPGVAANVGGVVVSFLEWSKNRGPRAHRVDLADLGMWVTGELTKIMHDVIGRVVKKSKDKKCSLSDAAHILAMEELKILLNKKHHY